MDSAHGPFHGDVVGAHVTELCADRVRGSGEALIRLANHAYAQLGKEVVEGRFAARFDLDPRLHDTRAMRGRGMTGSSSPWLAVVTSGSVSPAKLRYVPSPIADVACGSKICAAIGVTTVMTLRP